MNRDEKTYLVIGVIVLLLLLGGKFIWPYFHEADEVNASENNPIEKFVPNLNIPPAVINEYTIINSYVDAARPSESGMSPPPINSCGCATQDSGLDLDGLLNLFRPPAPPPVPTIPLLNIPIPTLPGPDLSKVTLSLNFMGFTRIDGQVFAGDQNTILSALAAKYGFRYSDTYPQKTHAMYLYKFILAKGRPSSRYGVQGYEVTTTVQAVKDAIHVA